MRSFIEFFTPQKYYSHAIKSHSEVSQCIGDTLTRLFSKSGESQADIPFITKNEDGNILIAFKKKDEEFSKRLFNVLKKEHALNGITLKPINIVNQNGEFTQGLVLNDVKQIEHLIAIVCGYGQGSYVSDFKNAFKIDEKMSNIQELAIAVGKPPVQEKSSNYFSYLLNVPNEIKQEMFKFLPLKDLLTVVRVSKLFRKVAQPVLNQKAIEAESMTDPSLFLQKITNEKWEIKGSLVRTVVSTVNQEAGAEKIANALRNYGVKISTKEILKRRSPDTPDAFIFAISLDVVKGAMEAYIAVQLKVSEPKKLGS